MLGCADAGEGNDGELAGPAPCIPDPPGGLPRTPAVRAGTSRDFAAQRRGDKARASTRPGRRGESAKRRGGWSGGKVDPPGWVRRGDGEAEDGGDPGEGSGDAAEVCERTVRAVSGGERCRAE